MPLRQRSELTIRVWEQDNGYFAAMVECPAFVDQGDLFHDAEEALQWADQRLRSYPNAMREDGGL